jgi:hypothetical protein
VRFDLTTRLREVERTIALTRQTERVSEADLGWPIFAREVYVAVRLNDHFNSSLKSEGYLDRKRRAKPSAPRAAPSNITVVPPSGTLLIVGGIGWGTALAFWLNASIRAQTAAETITSLFERVFDFIAQ